MAESTTITSNYYYVYPDCPYRHVCSDNGKKCEFCRYNPKRSYYEPVEPYIPYVPYYPYPYYTGDPPYYYWHTTCSSSTGESHYQEI